MVIAVVVAVDILTSQEVLAYTSDTNNHVSYRIKYHSVYSHTLFALPDSSNLSIYSDQSSSQSSVFSDWECVCDYAKSKYCGCTTRMRALPVIFSYSYSLLIGQVARQVANLYIFSLCLTMRTV